MVNNNNNKNEIKPEEIIQQPSPQDQEQYITISKKEYDVLVQSARLSLKNMIDTGDSNYVLLGESMMHSWNIYQNILNTKKNLQITHNEMQKQAAVSNEI